MRGKRTWNRICWNLVILLMISYELYITGQTSFHFRHKGGLLNREALCILILSAGDLILHLSTGLSQAGKSIYYLFEICYMLLYQGPCLKLFWCFCFLHVYILTLQLLPPAIWINNEGSWVWFTLWAQSLRR